MPLATTLLTTAALLAGTAMPPRAATPNLAEVTVTARRREERLQSVPAAVSVAGRVVLEGRAA